MTASALPATAPAPLDAIQRDLLTAGLCLAGKLQNPSQHFEDAILTLADRRYRGLGLQEVLLTAAQANGHRERHFRGELTPLLRAAFSNQDIGGILSNVANKFLLEGFNGTDQSWRAIATTRPVNDFKPVSSFRLTGSDQYEKVGPGGALKHGTLGEVRYQNQADTYGRMIAVSRQDIINDDLGALTTVPRKLGRGAALAFNEVFWSEFLDHADFFSAGNGNLISGTTTALTIDGLTMAERAFLEQLDPDGKPLGAMPKVLLVPNGLSVMAAQLMHSTEIRDNTPDATYPTSNPHVGKYQVVRSTYLAAKAQPHADPTAWYLLADPHDLATIEVAFLNGNETPTIEHAMADFSMLGIQMRGVHDFGVRKQEPRAAIKMAGK